MFASCQHHDSGRALAFQGEATTLPSVLYGTACTTPKSQLPNSFLYSCSVHSNQEPDWCQIIFFEYFHKAGQSTSYGYGEYSQHTLYIPVVLTKYVCTITYITNALNAYAGLPQGAAFLVMLPSKNSCRGGGHTTHITKRRIHIELLAILQTSKFSDKYTASHNWFNLRSHDTTDDADTDTLAMSRSLRSWHRGNSWVIQLLYANTKSLCKH